MSKRIDLIGTVHRDPKGKEKLLACLDLLAPDTLILEASPYSVSFRRQNSPRLLGLLDRRIDELNRKFNSDCVNHGEIEAIRAMLQMPFEIEAASEGTGKSRKIIFAGDITESKKYLDEIEETLLSFENLEYLISKPNIPLFRQVEDEYSRARNHLHLQNFSDKNLDSQNLRMAQAAKSKDSNIVVVVCGWEHLPGLHRLIGGSLYLLDKSWNEPLSF